MQPQQAFDPLAQAGVVAASLRQIGCTLCRLIFLQSNDEEVAFVHELKQNLGGKLVKDPRLQSAHIYQVNLYCAVRAEKDPRGTTVIRSDPSTQAVIYKIEFYNQADEILRSGEDDPS